VVTRYGFNQNILWALELTVFLFGWLVLLGASYAVKKGAHLGVDIVVNALPVQPRRIMRLAAVVVCISFSLLMLKALGITGPISPISRELKGAGFH
jgi:C4-dicarboxylate transporter DctQ subunit